MYLQRMDVGLDQETVFEVISLCDKYLIQDLVETAIDAVGDGITKENCVAFCDAILKFDMKQCSRLMDVAFGILTKNVGEILEKFGTSMSCKLWMEILMLEGPKAIVIEEIVLFSHLLKWKNADIVSAERKQEFQSLVPLIRFPLMDLITITQVVKPSGVLTSDELVEIMAYKLPGGDKEAPSVGKFSTQPRRPAKIARDSKNLREILYSSKFGDIIQLLPCEYLGPFTVKTYNVTIKGDGPFTVLTLKGDVVQRMIKSGKAILGLQGNGIKISDLQFVSPNPHDGKKCTVGTASVGLGIEGSGNTVTNTRFENCYLKIVKGNQNIVSDIHCKTGFAGVVIKSGEKNSISAATFNNLEGGIIIRCASLGSLIKGVVCTKVKEGVVLKGNDNVVEDISYTFATSTSNEVHCQVGVWIVGGCGNIVNRVKCQGPEHFKTRKCYSLAITYDKGDNDREGTDPKNNVVTDCGTGPVEMGGENNSLCEVNCGPALRIYGRGHKLEKCSALGTWTPVGGDVTYKDCDVGKPLDRSEYYQYFH